MSKEMKIGKTLFIAAIGVLAAACQPPESGKPGTDIEYLHMPGNEGSGAPFTSAVRAGDTLYLSGVIGVVPGTLQVPESGIEEEARLAVVKCTVFLADEADRDAFNAIYMSYFDKLPARSGVTVKGLALSARAEVECIAIVE
jgi:enamine deaminase RidA (YjgF/YER057c/UK114 family)